MTGGSGSGPLVPTFHGFVHNSMDGLVLFEACLSGKLHHVPRRPHDRERSSLIKSGSIFIYEENASGIKRWTDGVAWSPSRILGNFLIYRELEKPFPPGEKKRAMKRKRSDQLDGQMGRRDSDDNEAPEVSMPPTPPSPKPQQEMPVEPGQENERELERQLIGSLVDSYGFRPDGLVKKTMSVSINGVSHHLVSYYKLDDVKNGVLTRPFNDPRLTNISVRPELYLKQNFRTPVEETEHYIVDPSNMHAHPGVSYAPMMGGYGIRPGSYMAPQGYHMYGMQSSAGMYASTPATAWQGAHNPAIGYGTQQYGNPSYSDYYNRTSAGTPQSAIMKTEDQGAAQQSYSHFANPTPFQPRPASGSFSSYQSPMPMRPSSSSGYAAVSQPQHTSPAGASANAHHQQQHQYSTTPTQAHSFDSKLPTQYANHQHSASYGSQQNPPVSAASQDQRIKSPTAAGAPIPSISSSHVSSYRQNNGYGAALDGSSTTHGTGALAGITPGYSATATQGGHYAGGSYGGYGAATQGYRTGTANNASISNAGHY